MGEVYICSLTFLDFLTQVILWYIQENPSSAAEVFMSLLLLKRIGLQEPYAGATSPGAFSNAI